MSDKFADMNYRLFPGQCASKALYGLSYKIQTENLGFSFFNYEMAMLVLKSGLQNFEQPKT